MLYEDVVEFINCLTRLNLGDNTAIHKFERAKKAFERTNIKVDPAKIILVAGTNGKGSTSAMLAHLLRSAGKSVGLYTSPHLMKINERINLSTDISNDEFVESFEYARSLGLELSHFEYLTIMACHHFFISNHVDYAIFEVGCGGLYDATNAIPHNTCVITKIGFDHEDLLGYTIEEIAGNKFGIIDKSGSTKQKVIHMPFNDESVEELASSYDAIFVKSCDFKMHISDQNEFSLENKYGRAKLALPGMRACENAALALTAFDELGYSPSAYMKSLEDVKWPGRMSSIQLFGKTVFISGDHNDQGIDSLLDILKTYSYDNIHIIVGIAKDKAYEDMLNKLMHVHNSRIYLTETTFKPRLIEDYGEWLSKCTAYDKDWINLIKTIDQSANDMILITGSLYLVGSAMSCADMYNMGCKFD